jgi:hypothetical protein
MQQHQQYLRAVEDCASQILGRDRHLHYLQRQLAELTDIAKALGEAVQTPESPFAILAIEAWNDYKAAYPDANR